MAKEQSTKDGTSRLNGNGNRIRLSWPSLRWGVGMESASLDRQIRVAAFHWLNERKLAHGEVFSRSELQAGFLHEGERVGIVGPKGIFKPSSIPSLPLSITTIPGGPYDDDLRDGASVIHYRYRGTDPNHPDNIGLRHAMKSQTPLIFCYRIQPDRYLVSYPVFISGDDPTALTFLVQLDDEIGLRRYMSRGAEAVDEEATLHRKYVTISAKRRLHQVAFRERVLSAYRTTCALCRLRHGALLDAAHIIPDGEPDGEPEVSNGLALCKIHHAAYDLNYLGITPNYKVEVRKELMDEVDGPMLQHGIKGMHGEKIHVPRPANLRPSRKRLEARFEKFLASS